MPDSLPALDDILGPDPKAPQATTEAESTQVAAQAGTPIAPPVFTPAPVPSLDDILGAAPKPQALPSPELQDFDKSGAGLWGVQPPGANEVIANSPVGHILDAFGQGAKQGWGTDKIGLSDESVEALKKVGVFNDAAKGQQSILRTFNEAVFRPLAAGLDVANRILGSVQGAAEAGIAQAGAETGTEIGGQLGRDIAAGIESFGGLAGSPGSLHGEPHRIETQKSVGALGGDEGLYFDTERPKATDDPVIQSDITRPATAANENLAAPAPAATPQPQVQPDIHAVARQIAPDVFIGPKGYDALQTQKQTFQRWIQELGDARDQSSTADIDSQIADTQNRLQDATGKRAATYRNRLADLQDQRAQVAEQAKGDTRGMQRVRQALMKTDYALRDLAPQVSAAYREAQSRVPEAEETGSKTVAPETAPPVAVQPEQTAEPVSQQEAAPEQVSQTQPETAVTLPVEQFAAKAVPAVDIAQDVSKQLVAAGRPAEEANAAAALIASHYEARAANLKGTTAQQLYAEEAPQIRAAGARQRELELAQRGGRKTELGGGKGTQGTLFQPKRGSVTFANGRSVIKLFKDADASTFLHETGHQWLEELTRDAADERATDQVRTDAKTVRDWLGVKEDQSIPRAAHEKFARGFERYMMEGRAPSKALADVFAKFKAWLTQIYETVTRLKAPINDDIRDVFDRLVTKTPEKPVIAADMERGKGFADLHEADAEHTPPEQAEAVGDNIRDERHNLIDQEIPEAKDAILEGVSTEAGEREAGSGEPEEASGERNRPAETRPVEEPREVGGSGSEPAPEGPDVGAGPSEPSGPPPGRVEPRAAQPGTQLKDLAGNIRLENLHFENEEDARAIVRQVASENQDFRDARFGDPAYQLQRQIRAAGALLENTADAASDAFEKWKASGSEADAEAFELAKQRVLLAANVRAELAAGTGRGLAAFKALKRRGPTENMVNYIKRTEGKTLFQLQEEGDLFNQLETPEQKAKFLNETMAGKWQKTRSMILSYFINNLISGPLTHGAYSVGNTTYAILKGVDIAATATIDTVREYINGAPLEDRVYFSEVPAALYGLWRGWRDALPASWSAVKTGIPFMKGHEELVSRGLAEPIPIKEQPLTEHLGKVGYALETPGRSVSAIHTMFYAANYELEIARRAVRSAIKAGLDGDEYNTHVAEYVAKPPDADVQEAHDEALKMVLMKRPPYDSFMGSLNRAVNNNLAAKIVMPFMQIGGNILREGIVEHSPIGIIASKHVRENLAGMHGNIARSTQYAKIAVGTTAAVATMSLAMEGMITGGGPSDPGQRRLKEQSGWLPYSIKVGDTYIPYRKFLGPLGPLIASSADMYEIGHAAGQGEYAEAASSLLFGFSEVVADETWMSGLSNFINAAKNFDRDGGKYLRGLATDFIPFSIGLGQIAKAVDPYARRVNSLVDAIKSKIPGVSESLLPLRDMWGNPLASRNMLSPSSANNDPATLALQQLKFAPSRPGNFINGVRLSPEQYDDYSRISGIMAHARITALVKTPGFQAYMQTNSGQATKAISDIIKDSRKTARAQVQMKSMAQDGPNNLAALAARQKLAKITGTGAKAP